MTELNKSKLFLWTCSARNTQNSDVLSLPQLVLVFGSFQLLLENLVSVHERSAMKSHKWLKGKKVILKKWFSELRCSKEFYMCRWVCWPTNKNKLLKDSKVFCISRGKCKVGWKMGFLCLKIFNSLKFNLKRLNRGIIFSLQNYYTLIHCLCSLL